MLNKFSQWFKESAIVRALKKHVSKSDIAFIAAGYAFPFPGTGPGASMIVTIKITYKYFCRLLKKRQLSKTLDENVEKD